MSARVWIPLKFPSLNQYIQAERGNKFVAAKMKRDWTDTVVDYAMIRKGRVFEKVTKFPVTVRFNIHEANTRRDIDGVLSFVSKAGLDGIVKAGIIPDDSQKYVNKIECNLVVDGKVGVEILINETI